MREFRAKDADRDRYVALIEAAHADGQLGDADRDLRVSRARSAETLDELETLTRDLRRPPVAPPAMTAPTALMPPTAQMPPTAYARTRTVRRRPGSGVPRLVVTLVVLAMGLGALGVASVVIVMFAATDSPVADPLRTDSSGSDSGVVDTADRFELSPATVRDFVAAYREEFGTTAAFEVVFYPGRIQAQVPVRGSRPRMERWSWDGDWRQDAQASAVVGPDQRVEAAAFDVRRMFANIAVARRSLDVEDAVFTHAILHRWDDDPAELTIYVSNEFSESGFLATTPEGRITRRVPYAP